MGSRKKRPGSQGMPGPSRPAEPGSRPAPGTRPAPGKKASGGPFEALRAMRVQMIKKPAATSTGNKSHEGAGPPPPRPAPARPLDPRAEGGSKGAVAATGGGAGATPEDDALLFHRLFAGVEPLDRSRGGRLPRQEVAPSPEAERAARRGREHERAETEAVHERLRALVEGGSRFEVADDGRRVEGRRDDLPPEALRRLRRGLLPIDARLDLHGLHAEEARARLEAFLGATRGRGERCVLVIHGKGEHSPRGIGILRGEIAAWLSQGGASRHVAAFTTAAEGDGGEGAVYVLLRR